MSDVKRIRDEVFPATFSLLEPKLDSRPARAMLLAIGLQESRFEYRKQIGGPAHGFWQFEEGGGVRGVLRHPATSGTIRAVLAVRGVADATRAAYDAIVNDDVLACAFARLLLWTLPGALPDEGDCEAGWQQYVAAWRPGKPHRHTWDAFYAQAWLLVNEPRKPEDN